jgi:hypothetical protein
LPSNAKANLRVALGSKVSPVVKKYSEAHTSYVAVKRGYSTEGDQLLDYIEYGIFDALEKQYLKSFVFVIYLVCLSTSLAWPGCNLSFGLRRTKKILQSAS